MKNDVSKNFIEKTKNYWSSYYEYELSDSQAAEIIQNTNEFFGILLRWKKRKEERDQIKGSDDSGNNQIIKTALP
jgi:hypothetical protein